MTYREPARLQQTNHALARLLQFPLMQISCTLITLLALIATVVVIVATGIVLIRFMLSVTLICKTFAFIDVVFSLRRHVDVGLFQFCWQ